MLKNIFLCNKKIIFKFTAMKKTKQNEKKLSLKKLQISKINNLGRVQGGKLTTGFEIIGDDGCMFPENASKIKDGPIGSTGQ